MEDINLEPITTVLWLAEDHKPTEVRTLMETALTSIFGLYAARVGLKVDLANLPFYGIFKFQQEFVSFNKH